MSGEFYCTCCEMWTDELTWCVKCVKHTRRAATIAALKRAEEIAYTTIDSGGIAGIIGEAIRAEREKVEKE